MTDHTPTAAGAALYRAVWRWHFIAGLIVLPFMLILAVTGGIYLFKDEINRLAYAELRQIAAPAEQGATPLPPAQITAAALAEVPGTLRAYTPPAKAGQSAEVDIAPAEGPRTTVFVHPTTGAVLGQHADAGAAGSPFMKLVRKLHSLEYVGWLGNRLIEAAAGWMVLLTLTGIYLWWPRGRGVGTTRIKAQKGRPYWRDLHAVTGIYTAAFIVFLAMTGLPWSSVWGGYFYDAADALDLGMPEGYWSNIPKSDQPLTDAVDHAPWIMGQQKLPLSGNDLGTSVALNEVVATVEARGLVPGYSISLPKDAQGVITASVYPDDIRNERVIHLDQYSGEVIYDAGFEDLGTLGRWAEWGISVHMGQEFGRLNQIVLALACLAMIVLPVSGAVMWWKRRPSGALGVPPVPVDGRIPRGLLVMAVAAGLFFPLVGLSLLVLAVVEMALYLRRRRRDALAA